MITIFSLPIKGNLIPSQVDNKVLNKSIIVHSWLQYFMYNRMKVDAGKIAGDELSTLTHLI